MHLLTIAATLFHSQGTVRLRARLAGSLLTAVAPSIYTPKTATSCSLAIAISFAMPAALATVLPTRTMRMFVRASFLLIPASRVACGSLDLLDQSCTVNGVGEADLACPAKRFLYLSLWSKSKLTNARGSPITNLLQRRPAAAARRQ